ncbi:hypothetical protein P879_07592 [Paragonimus westermani]|uniref:TLC domain-containing protein n=1 Tax=Paragonimus westermani TaxID=34504 RepID=A0A8T0CY52_9TREM|nr:hypothetical protein P879_07592 [Paragonimus westermani]
MAQYGRFVGARSFNRIMGYTMLLLLSISDEQSCGPCRSIHILYGRYIHWLFFIRLLGDALPKESVENVGALSPPFRSMLQPSSLKSFVYTTTRTVLSTFIYNILTVKFIGYTVVALLAEVNSIFLHTRKLMQMHKVSFISPVYRFNAVLNLLTFAGCRGYCLFRITYGMYTESHHMSFFYRTLLCVSMCIMNVLNPILFWILFRNDFLRTPVPGQLSKSELNNFTDGRDTIAYNNISTRFDGPITLSPLGPKLRNNDLMIPELDLT